MFSFGPVCFDNSNVVFNFEPVCGIFSPKWRNFLSDQLKNKKLYFSEVVLKIFSQSLKNIISDLEMKY